MACKKSMISKRVQWSVAGFSFNKKIQTLDSKKQQSHKERIAAQLLNVMELIGLNLDLFFLLFAFLNFNALFLALILKADKKLAFVVTQMAQEAQHSCWNKWNKSYLRNVTKIIQLEKRHLKCLSDLELPRGEIDGGKKMHF